MKKDNNNTPDYPLYDNKKWYAENGTVYNEADDKFRILMVCSGTEITLPYGCC